MTAGFVPLRILSAGSLRNAIGAIVRHHFPSAEVTFGPAGLLRERIEAGAGFDVFLSADMGHPLRLAAQGLATAVECFTRNSLVVVARASLGVDQESLLDTMADPAVRLGTSTRGTDPSGDYAMQFFDSVEKRRPGLGAHLAAKALPLVGGTGSAPVPEGVPAAAFLIEVGLTDLFIGYATGARPLEGDARFSVIPLPGNLAPVAEYGLCVATQAEDDARAFRALLLRDAGQGILASFGFLPA